jgi:hypothetical protein
MCPGGCGEHLTPWARCPEARRRVSGSCIGLRQIMTMGAVRLRTRNAALPFPQHVSRLETAGEPVPWGHPAQEGRSMQEPATRG